MALKIGPLAVDPPVVLAPMAGVTNPAFRQLCRGYGGGLYVSEITSRVENYVIDMNDVSSEFIDYVLREGRG